MHLVHTWILHWELCMTSQIYTHKMVMNMNWDSSTTTRIGPCWSSILLRTAPTAKIDRDSANTVQPSRVIHGILLCCRREPVNQQIRQYSNACCSYASYWEASVIDGHLPQLMLRLLLRGLLPAHNTYVVWRSGNIPRNSSAADSQSAPVQRLNYKWCLCSEGCISWLLTACLIQSQQLVRCRVASHIALIKNPARTMAL